MFISPLGELCYCVSPGILSIVKCTDVSSSCFQFLSVCIPQFPENAKLVSGSQEPIT